MRTETTPPHPPQPPPTEHSPERRPAVQFWSPSAGPSSPSPPQRCSSAPAIATALPAAPSCDDSAFENAVARKIGKPGPPSPPPGRDGPVLPQGLLAPELHAASGPAAEPAASEPVLDVSEAAPGPGLSCWLAVWAPLLPLCGVLLLMGLGLYFSVPIRRFIRYFSAVVHSWGALGVVAFFALYVVLEMLMTPVIPLTMMAGAVFDVVGGTIITSLAGSLAAVLSFSIARYGMRGKFKAWAHNSPSFRAIDAVIGANGFKVVVLLRLSPLFPLAASNYLYGLTSVKLRAYALGTWLGMLPGTLTYVVAGKLSKLAVKERLPLQWWQVALAVGMSVITVAYIGWLAKRALQDLRDDASPTSSRSPLLEGRLGA